MANLTPKGKRATNRRCLTPGATYHTAISGNRVVVSVQFPGSMVIGEGAAAEIDRELHDAVEAVLARYWPKVWSE